MAEILKRVALLIALLLTISVGLVWSQSQNKINDELKHAVEKELQNQIPDLAGFNLSMLPFDEFATILRNKCISNSGESAYENVKAKQAYYQSCVSNFVDVMQIQKELEKEAMTGSMEKVFGKYCGRYPAEVKVCLNELQASVLPCFEDIEKESVNKTFFITDKVITFSCDKNGDRMAMFVAEGGVECVNASKAEIQKCVTSVFGEKIIAAMPELNGGKIGALPPFILKEEYYKEFDELHLCVRTALEACEESTPANVIDALFKYVRKLMFTTPRNSASLFVTETVLIIVNIALLTRLF